MIWRDHKDHNTDCYFCLVPPLKQGISEKKRWTATYPNLPSVVRPISHGGLPVPGPPGEYHLDNDDEAEVISYHRISQQWKKKYQGKLSPSMLADYCWIVTKDAPVVT
ncbi:hypothetical protein PR048_014661 [Dryococelus australis]|uniref:Uncharacterized protein n=1 Tax=Dryococelus australis TaxID=614101 RepID=A0ABQ9HF24_9NEOP|nr:hypothetical protein PR048_014661 [Dryococelus australis]